VKKNQPIGGWVQQRARNAKIGGPRAQMAATKRRTFAAGKRLNREKKRYQKKKSDNLKAPKVCRPKTAISKTPRIPGHFVTKGAFWLPNLFCVCKCGNPQLAEKAKWNTR